MVAWGKFVHSLGWGNFQPPCELHSILRINPYNWTFPNCNISFIMDQSTNKTTNEWLLQVACRKPVLLWEPCYSLGKKPIVWVVRKARTDILLADLVCFEVQCLPRSAHLKFPKMSSFWWRRFKLACTFLSFLFLFYFLHQLLLVCLLLCSLLLLLLSIFLHLTNTVFCQKRLCFLVSLCYVV